MRKVILASKSPRRKELLEMVGIEVIVDVVETSEELLFDVPLEKAIENIALEKGLAVSKKYPEDIIVSADTVVVLENQILGKPKDEQDAFEMLALLRNKKHQVITSVCILCGQKRECFSSITEVEMMDYSDELIWSYIHSKEPLDKAGAYGIQGQGAILVKRINGDYYTVMGLPLAEVYNCLGKYL